MRYFVLLGYVLLSVVGCAGREEALPMSRRNNIHKIEFAVNGWNTCFKPGAVISIMIDSSLQYHYYGDTLADIQGYRSGQITRGFWDTLNIGMEKIDYRSLPDSGELANGTSILEMYVHNSQGRKHFYGTHFGHDMYWMMTWLYTSPKRIDLQWERYVDLTCWAEPPLPNLHIHDLHMQMADEPSSP